MKIRTYFWLILLLVVGLTIFGIWDRNFYIGGDVMIPIVPHNNLHKMNMWFAGSDSLHYLHVYWYLYYFILEKIGIHSQYAQKILIVLGTGFSFFYTYRLFVEIFIKSSQKYIYGLLGGLFYSTSAAIFLVVPGYLPFYGIPICSYYFVRYLKNVRFGDIFLFSIFFNAFFFVDLPQPKIIISYFLFLVYFLALLKGQHPDYTNLVRGAIVGIIVFVLVNSQIILPFVYSVTSGSIGKLSGSIASHNGLADIGSASIIYISRFFNTSSFINYKQASRILSGPLFSLVSFLGLLVILIFNNRPAKKQISHLWVCSLITFLSIIFLAKGGNPPFGILYQWIVDNIPLARIFRTTANIIIIALIPFSVLLSISVSNLLHHFGTKIALPIFIFLYLFAYGGSITGNRYYNHHGIPPGKGINIPTSYFEAAKYLDSLPNSAKVLLLPFPDGYISKSWGYFGPDILSWMSRANFVYRSDLYGISTEDGKKVSNFDLYGASIYSTADYIVIQKDSLDSPNLNTSGLTKTWSNPVIDVYHTGKVFEHVVLNNAPEQIFLHLKKFNYTNYQFTIFNINSTSNLDINLRENYHQGWRLCLDNQIDFFAINNCIKPSVGKDNTNLWRVSAGNICSANHTFCSKNNLNGHIVFWPQNLLIFSTWVSALSVILGFIFLLINIARKPKNVV